jgi:hypothetical protein
MRFLNLVALAGLFAGCRPAPPPAKPPAAAPPSGITFKIVKWPELEAAIAAHRGKVVLIDLWAEY